TITDPETGEQIKQAREVLKRKIMWGKLSGMKCLDKPQEWDGQYIPCIPIYGNRYNLDGKRCYEGIVQPNISPCQMLNYMVTAAAQKIGLASVAPWLVAAGQLQGYEAWWSQANTRNFPYLEYNVNTDQANGLPPPVRNNDNPQIQAYGEMIGVFKKLIRSTTGVPDAALGHANSNDKSGKAIAQLQRASEQGASNWLFYQAGAIRHTGCVLIDLAPAAYD